MTEIELALLKTIGQFILSSLREAWSNVVPLRPTMQEPVLSPELAQFATMAEATVMLVLEVVAVQDDGHHQHVHPVPGAPAGAGEPDLAGLVRRRGAPPGDGYGQPGPDGRPDQPGHPADHR